jgi:hypothetical protein
MADSRTVFGAPGMTPQWASSAKEAVGTAYSPGSRLWFTLAHGDGGSPQNFWLMVRRPGQVFNSMKWLSQQPKQARLHVYSGSSISTNG